jgi:hypothetical protein
MARKGDRVQRMIADARTHTDLPADVFMYVGGFETIGDGPRQNRIIDMVGDLALFQRQLQPHGYPGLKIRSVVLEVEDHLTV